jgi:hypothetical protein
LPNGCLPELHAKLDSGITAGHSRQPRWVYHLRPQIAYVRLSYFVILSNFR